MLNRPLKGRRLLRLIFFTPYVLSEAITAIVFLQILQPDGLLDAFLKSSGSAASCISGSPISASSSTRSSS